jgi:hypothetical protein
MATTRSPQKLLGEQVGPGLPGGSPADRLTGLGVDLANGVEAILLMVLGSLEAVAFAGDAVHENRTVELLGLLEGSLDRWYVVAIDRPHVLQAQVGEHALWRQYVL